MHPLRKKKLLTIIIILSGLSLAIALVLYALRQNLNHFYTPTELKNEQPKSNQTIRVGGLVVAGSVSRNIENLNVTFTVTDQFTNNLQISYHGILPDLFREGQGIIAIGKLNPEKTQLIADEVLAKHDEKYMPPELKKSLEQPLPQKKTN